MNLLLAAHRLHPHVGGTEIAVDELAARFAARGHDVAVATSAEPGAPAEETRRGYHIRRFAMRRFGKFRVPPPEYRRLALAGDHDLLHLHGQRVWSSDHLYRHLGRARMPVVFTAHGFAQWHRRRKPIVDAAYYKVVLPRALRHVARVTALTEAERRDLAAWGVAPEKIRVIGDGYDPAEFVALPAGFRARHGFAADERLLLYAGGFYPNKRVDRLVEAASGLDATLVVLGKDADGSRAACEALAARLGVRLRALGRVPREDVLSAYRESDVFVLGSDFEGYGLVLLEAMASGLPFVSTPCGAAPDLAATGAGALAAGADEMRESLRDLLTDPARRAQMGRRGKEAAPRHTWDAVAETYLRLFDEVLAR